MNKRNLNIYHAAELFNLPARFFNESLVDLLESNGLKVFSPQRNGFEFTQLEVSLREKKISPELIEQTINTIIYTYDIFSISKSDLVVARFDEPQDPGVNTEVLIANSLKIPVIGYRTDVRSPYGLSSDKNGGMHSFPIRTSEIFIIQPSSLSIKKDFEDLVNSILKKTKEISCIKKGKLDIPKFLKPTFKLASTLFNGIENLHSLEGTKKLVIRCQKNQKLIANFGPIFIKN